MEAIENILLYILNFVLFVALSLLFVPAFLIVTVLQETWSTKMKEVLGL